MIALLDDPLLLGALLLVAALASGVATGVAVRLAYRHGVREGQSAAQPLVDHLRWLADLRHTGLVEALRASEETARRLRAAEARAERLDAERRTWGVP